MNRILFFLTPLFLSIGCLSSENKQKAIPDLLFADGNQLLSMKNKYLNQGEREHARIELLLRCATNHLDLGPFSVMQKDIIPPSGDKHDYISQGPYWWPDTTKSDGLPYIRRDGVVNPEREKFTDRQNLKDLIQTTGILSKAYFVTGEEKYAHRTIKLLDIWFLNDSTKMNPNLEYGQGIPGITEGRGIGIIETSQLGRIADVLTLLSTSKSWTKELDREIKTWLREYLDWLLNSKKGKDESIHPNNHGTWYDVQAISIAICTGQEELARSIVENSKTKRFDSHIMQDGSQPKEITRTKSFSYSAMNLKGLMHIAYLAEKVGIDLWHYSNKHGATIKEALDFLLSAVIGDEQWEYEQITPIDESSLDFHLFLASKYYDEGYLRKIKRNFEDNTQLDCDGLELIIYGL